jgi:hypothetical protein
MQIFFITTYLLIRFHPVLSFEGGRSSNQSRKHFPIFQIDRPLPNTSIYRRIDLKVPTKRKRSVESLVPRFRQRRKLLGKISVIIINDLLSHKIHGTTRLPKR